VTPTEVPRFGTVSNTGGQGLNCRTEPSISGSIITILRPGDQVNVRGATENDWIPVTCDDTDGWVAAPYLTVAEGTPPPPSPTATVVYSTPGQRVACRLDPNIDSLILARHHQGEQVVVRGETQNRWVPVVCNGMDGWIFEDELQLP
jgi:uncharacterized protein YgiM (DUF1202 family)